MQQFEKDYAELINKVLSQGEIRNTRNGETQSIFGEVLNVPLNGDYTFPIIQGRKMYPDGVLGELAAMLRKPTHISDFETWGCNYWKTWAKPDGSIAVDYGNAWHADNQIEHLKDALANNPHDRRMIINGWRPGKLKELDLPCCHLLYQFYVREGKFLDIMWYQRSVDMMVGLPSDIIFAAAWLISIVNEFNMIPGNITMVLGDCHVYSEHYSAAQDYVGNVQYDNLIVTHPTYRLNAEPGKDFCSFEPSDIILSTYPSRPKINLELKA